MEIYKCNTKLWLYPGDTANWHFLTIPKDIGQKIKEEHKSVSRGFGSLPVEVTIGKSTWQTSIFPDSRVGTYILPVKAKIRKSEDLYVDDTVKYSFKVRK